MVYYIYEYARRAACIYYTLNARHTHILNERAKGRSVEIYELANCCLHRNNIRTHALQ